MAHSCSICIHHIFLHNIYSTSFYEIHIIFTMERKEESGFTVERWARGAAWQAGHGATASSLLRRQLLLDLLQPRALLEAAHAIDHPWGHVSPDTRLASVGIDGKNMGSASEGADHHPAAVVAEGDILYLENRGDMGMKPPTCAHPTERSCLKHKSGLKMGKKCLKFRQYLEFWCIYQWT